MELTRLARTVPKLGPDLHVGANVGCESRTITAS